MPGWTRASARRAVTLLAALAAVAQLWSAAVLGQGAGSEEVTQEVFPGEDLARLRGLPQAVRDELTRCFTLAAADEAFVGESGEQ